MSKLYRARSLLYRRQILQENIRWKALNEIYKIYILLHRADLNIRSVIILTVILLVIVAVLRADAQEHPVGSSREVALAHNALAGGLPLRAVSITHHALVVKPSVARILFNQHQRYLRDN